jgi:type VI protein secretion system component VasK
MNDLLSSALLLSFILHLGLWLWVAREIVRRKDLHWLAQTLWLLVIIALPLAGLILYSLIDPRAGVRFEAGRPGSHRHRT